MDLKNIGKEIRKRRHALALTQSEASQQIEYQDYEHIRYENTNQTVILLKTETNLVVDHIHFIYLGPIRFSRKKRVINK